MARAAAAPKPKFLVVENALKCQTANGELSLPLTVKFGTVRKLMGGENKTQFEEFEFFMTEIFDDAANAAIDALDTAEAAAVLTEFSDALADRMKVSMGKSAGSAASSTGTEEQ
ncbi:hypothetical protein IRJ34_07320 [Paenarthrobacter sp. GOM3]|uniref:hypothetical protein n=1 Tax=Paenarthrobacter sp. GOM3 TaxID=2782567 RepID=UPI001BAC2F9D|nr:hypothetical protein [Paenarthrobacter sp. GOM3]WOH20126.1 hypothetical protein IRJ34_07320 [Paenarthrobacter sp. GOM3]